MNFVRDGNIEEIRRMDAIRRGKNMRADAPYLSREKNAQVGSRIRHCITGYGVRCTGILRRNAGSEHDGWHAEKEGNASTKRESLGNVSPSQRNVSPAFSEPSFSR